MLLTRSMKVFFALYQERNIIAAANTLCLTVPPVKRMLNLTEEWLGERLFITERNSLKPTQLAESMYSQLYPHYAALNTFKMNLHKKGEKRFRIASPQINQSFITDLLTPTVDKFSKCISLRLATEMHAQDDVFISIQPVRTLPHFELHVIRATLNLHYKKSAAHSWDKMPILCEQPLDISLPIQETYKKMLQEGYEGRLLRNDNSNFIASEFEKSKAIVFRIKKDDIHEGMILPYVTHLNLFIYVNKYSTEDKCRRLVEDIKMNFIN